MRIGACRSMLKSECLLSQCSRLESVELVCSGWHSRMINEPRVLGLRWSWR